MKVKFIKSDEHFFVNTMIMYGLKHDVEYNTDSLDSAFISIEGVPVKVLVEMVEAVVEKQEYVMDEIVEKPKEKAISVKPDKPKAEKKTKDKPKEKKGMFGRFEKCIYCRNTTLQR